MTLETKAKIYYLKKKALLSFGFKTGLIRVYGSDLIERYHKIYYGGIPVSIILLSPPFCRGYCYDRTLLAAMGFEDTEYEYIQANIDGIKYSQDVMQEIAELKKEGKEPDPNYANHAYLEVKLSGSTWIIDTTSGLAYSKKLWDFMENPQVTLRRSKQETMDYIEYREIKSADINKDKYATPLILPYFEKQISKSAYKDLLVEEIEQYKKEINYDAVCAEINNTIETDDSFGFIKNLF